MMKWKLRWHWLFQWNLVQCILFDSGITPSLLLLLLLLSGNNTTNFSPSTWFMRGIINSRSFLFIVCENYISQSFAACVRQAEQICVWQPRYSWTKEAQWKKEGGREKEKVKVREWKKERERKKCRMKNDGDRERCLGKGRYIKAKRDRKKGGKEWERD